MTYKLTWMPEVLAAAGLKVAEVPGWRARGHGDMGTPRGVLLHHTVGPLNGNMPSLGVLTNGRGPPKPLAGPLAHLGLGRDGTWYVVAAGRAFHAGPGQWRGCTDGNSELIGIEAENNGTTEVWPAAQMTAYRHGVAALLKKMRAGAAWCAGHKEYALPKGRKIDPNFDMPMFRRGVAAILGESVPLLPVVPNVDDEGRPTLRRGLRNPATEADVRQVQRAVGAAPVDGAFGPKTEAAVRAWQRSHRLVPDGIVGPETWARMAQVKPDFVSNVVS